MSSTLCHESAANIRPLIVVQPLKITSSICLHLTCIHHNKILESISNFRKNIWKWSFLSQTESVYWIFQISNFQSLIMSKIRVFQMGKKRKNRWKKSNEVKWTNSMKKKPSLNKRFSNRLEMNSHTRNRTSPHETERTVVSVGFVWPIWSASSTIP